MRLELSRKLYVLAGYQAFEVKVWTLSRSLISPPYGAGEALNPFRELFFGALSARPARRWVAGVGWTRIGSLPAENSVGLERILIHHPAMASAGFRHGHRNAHDGKKIARWIVTLMPMTQGHILAWLNRHGSGQADLVAAFDSGDIVRYSGNGWLKQHDVAPRPK